MASQPAARIGQCGVEKSGNYLLYRVLRTAMERAGTFHSHAARSGCWDSLFQLDAIPLSFPEQRDLDEAEVHEHQVYARNSHLKARFAVRDLERFDREAALLWTHQAPLADHDALLGAERRWLYLIRDGRDVVNSWIHYATSPRMRARHPEYTADTPEALYANTAYFEKSVDRWARHVEAYLERADRYALVRYEDLARDRAGEIARLTRFAGLEGDVDVAELMFVAGTRGRDGARGRRREDPRARPRSTITRRGVATNDAATTSSSTTSTETAVFAMG